MKPGECVAFAFRAFSGHGVRTGLSLAGVAIGVAAVVVLTAIGEGAQHYVTGQFASLGSNLLIVVPGYNETTGAIPGFGGAPNDLTIADAEALLRRVPEIRLASPIVVGEERVKHQERSRRVPILGATAELLEIRDLTMERGSFLPAGPWDRGDRKSVV